MIIIVFIGGQLLYYIDTTQRDGSYQINMSISAFSPIVLSCIQSYVVNRHEFLHAHCGLFLHPATRTGVLATGWYFQS